MNIALIGYGKMGKVIEKIAKDRGHNIVSIIDKNDDISSIKVKDVDVAIEFSTPEAAFNNISTCIESNIPVVTGTTGWHDRYEEIVDLTKENNGSFIFASNFSIGVNLFFEMNKKMAKLLNSQSDFDVSIEETHHIHKLDEPSGTAITTANQIIENLDRKSNWSLTETNSNTLSISSIREGEVFGRHTVSYDSENDSIQLTHNAKSRNGLALGAIIAAEYIHDKKGIFTMSDILNF